MANVTVYNREGKEVETLVLNNKLSDGKVNKPLLQQVVSMYLANQRQGSASTKTRGEVRGGGKKPWRQKGTGRARHGSNRSPLWRGGGTVFGPHPKDWHYRLPKRMRRLALLSALNAKLNEKNIIVIDEIKLASYKTKDFVEILKNLKIDKAKLVLIPNLWDENLKRASRNVEKVILSRAQDINAYQVLVCDKILIEKQAFEAIEKDLTKVA